MATSGSFTTPNNAGLGSKYPKYLQFNWWQNSQSVSGNYTDIGWNVVFTGGNSGSWVYIYGANITVDGEYHDLSQNAAVYQGTVIGSGTKRIYHNNDGTRSFSASGGGNIYYSSGKWSGGSGTWTLETIARHCTATGSNGDITDEDNPYVTYTNPASASVRAKLELPSLGLNPISGTDVLVGTATSGTYTWSLSDTVRNTIRAAMTATTSTTIRMTVYDSVGGTTSYSYKDATITIKDGEPTFSDFTYADTNADTVAITNDDQILVSGKSELAVTISSENKAIGDKQATISTYTASISGLSKATTYSEDNVVITGFGTSFSSGQQTLAVKATDSRGKSTTITKDVTVLEYSSPVINATATRKNNFENTTTLDIKGNIAYLNNLNDVQTIQYRYKNQSSTTWTDWIDVSSWTLENGAVSTDSIYLDLDNSSAFTIEISLQDKLETTTSSLSVSIGIPIFRIGTDGYVYNNEKRILNTGDLPITSSNIASSAITAEKIAKSAFGGWKLLYASETTTAKSGTIFNFTIPPAYQKACLFFATSFEMSTYSWNDMRAYDTSSNLTKHTVNTVYSRNGTGGGEGISSCNYICAVSPEANDRKITMTGISIQSPNDSTWRHWQSFAGDGWHANYTSAFATTGTVGSIRLMTGGTIKARARIQIFGCI